MASVIRDHLGFEIEFDDSHLDDEFMSAESEPEKKPGWRMTLPLENGFYWIKNIRTKLVTVAYFGDTNRHPGLLHRSGLCDLDGNLNIVIWSVPLEPPADES